MASFRPNPNQPIPNNPFYYPETSFLQGDLGQLIVGSGLTIDYSTGIISSSGGGGGGAVNKVTGGTGVSVSPTTGNVVVSNTGVLQLTAGTGVTITGSKTNYTISSPYFGTVTSVTAGTGLTGGIITTSGTLAIDGNVVLLRSLYTAKGQILVSTGASLVSPLSSSGFPNGYILTLDSTESTGMKWAAVPTAVQTVTGIAPIQVTSGTSPVVSIATASTTTSGATTLVNDLLTNDGTKALTAAQGYSLQQQISGLTVGSSLKLAGTFNATTGNLLTVTTQGTAAGFTVGSPLPAAALGNKDYFVIATTPGTYTPPGGSSTAVTQGDWFNSTGTAWNFLNVGYDAPAATSSTPGLVQFATFAQAAGGTDNSTAMTPAATAFAARSVFTSKGVLISATAASSPSPLSVGTDGQVLMACSACVTGLTWASTGGSGIPCSVITAKGDVVTGTGANSPTALNVGTNGQVLTACSACLTGLTWATPASSGIPCSTLTAKGDLVAATGANTPVALTVGTDGQLLVACATATSGLCWLTSPYIPCSIVTAKGGLIGATGNGTPAFFGASSADGCLLASNSLCAQGLAWVAPPAAATPTALGLLRGCTEKNNNTFLGFSAGMFANAGTGTCSVAIGHGALTNTGLPICSANDVAVGAGAMGSIGCYTCGCCNTAIGYRALQTIKTNSGGNTAVGSEIYSRCVASGGGLSGSNNLILASGSGLTLPSDTASCQLAIGFSPVGFPTVANCYWLTGCSDKTIRPGAGIRDCANSVGAPRGPVGGSILYSMGAAGVCWDTPNSASPFCVGGLYGCNVPDFLSIGSNTGATSVLTPSTNFVALGANTANSVTLPQTVVVGVNALCSASSDNVADSVYIGYGAGCGIFGFATLGENTVVGARAATNVTSSYNTFIGSSTASTLTFTGTNNTAIGYAAEPASAGVSNTVTLGNNAITTLRAAVTSITSLSDARDKTNVQGLTTGIQFVKDLKPVTFQWQYREGNPTKDGTVDSGFLAQDLKETQGQHNADYLGLVNTDNPNRFEATPGKLIPVLVKALQELTEAHEKLRADFNAYVSSHP